MDINLSDSQLERLNDGDSVEVADVTSAKNIEVHPPCGVSRHDWRDPRVVDSGDTLRRTCRKCGESQEMDLDPDELFSSGGDGNGD